jgi:hypothetical protein
MLIMKGSIFWDIKPCSLLKFNRRFRGIYRLHLQGRRISHARNQSGSISQAQPTRMLISLLMFNWEVFIVLCCGMLAFCTPIQRRIQDI